MKRIFTILLMLSIVALFVIYPLTAKNLAKSASSKEKEYEYYYNENIDTGNTFMQDTLSTTEDKEPVTPSASLPVTMDLAADSLTVLVNKDYGLPSDYVPAHLIKPAVRFETDNYEEKNYMRKEAATALEQLFTAAEKEDCILYAVSGYRSYKRQQEIYQNNLYHKGYVATIAVSAEPGYSEHQTGLAMDISAASLSCDLSTRFASTPEGKWVAKNAYRYGYIVRYPENQSKKTGYTSEPWHIRYVGKKLATYLYDNSLTLDEYYGYTPSKKIIEQIKSMETLDIDNTDTPCDIRTPSPKRATPTTTPKPKNKNKNQTSKKTDKKKPSAVSGSAIH